MVSADLSDPPGSAPPSRAGVYYYRQWIPARHLQWRCADPRAILNLATSPAVEGQTGLYFNGLREAKAPQTQAYDTDARRQLKALSLELTGLSAEDVAALER